MSAGLGPAGRIGRFSIGSKLTPLLVVAALALGALAVSLTPREEEPQIVVPIVDLFVGMPGASPAEVESRVTVPLEKRMWEIPGVEYVYSVSRPHSALVTVRFLVGANPQESLVGVYEKVASGLDQIAAGVGFPLVRLRSIDDVPILTLTLWSDRYDGFGLRRIAAELARELAKIPDVSETSLHGGSPRALRVRLDPGRLAAHGLDAAAVAQAIGLQNAAAPAGVAEHGNREVLVETGAFLASAAEVAELVVGVSDGRPTHLREVGEILDGPAEPGSYVDFVAGPAATEKGIERPAAAGEAFPAVTLAIAKRKGADAQRVVGQVKAALADLERSLIPDGVEVTVTRDYGATATEKANELLVHLLFAILSVTVVIGLALGWRGALVVFLSVPVSFALTLFVYYGFGYTLNRVTLFALVFVTGIVVDDSIIVVENIVRHLRERRLPPLQAAIEAVDEVGNPTILATLTVIAAVLPMAFVRGLMGPYMRPMPVGAALAMTFSLAVALVIAPWFAYRLLRRQGEGEPEEEGVEGTRTYRVYRRILRPLLERPARRWAFLGAVAALLFLAVAFFPLRWVEVKMLPFDNKSELQVMVDMPEGTTLETTRRVARDLAGHLATVPEVTDVELYAGTAAPINFNGLVRHYDLRRGGNVADLQVNLRHQDEREDQSHAIAVRVRPALAAIGARHGAAVKVVEVPPGPPVLSTLVAEIYGPTAAARLALAERVRGLFADTAGVVDVDWTVEAPQPLLELLVDREKAALHGVGAARVAETLGHAFGERPIGLLHDPEEAEPVPIVLELARSERSDLGALLALRVLSRSGAGVPLSELVRAEERTLEPSRHRKNLRPVVYVTGDVAGSIESPVYAILDLAERLEELDVAAATGLPAAGPAPLTQLYSAQPASEAGPALKWDGEWHITYEVFRDLGGAFAAVLVLIYVLLIGWFGSFRTPLVMMIAIPLSLVGIVPGHFALGAFFTATSMIGFIALAGIMVRNSVLLIDFVELARSRGRSLEQAVLEAGAVRFRPILLTAGTVVVGAFVILFDPIFEGLAISLMFGTLASTVLTLVVVPLVYYLAERPGRAGGEVSEVAEDAEGALPAPGPEARGGG
jgi:multidrug efflux pump subunit AcrB